MKKQKISINTDALDEQYLNMLDDINSNFKYDLLTLLDMLDKKQLPKNYNFLKLSNYRMIIKSTITRNLLMPRIGFMLISEDLADKFAEYLKGKKCLEIMCGSGVLTKTLKDRNIDIIATDNFSWKSDLISDWNTRKNYWCNIENIDCIKAIEKYGKEIDYIIMSWPPYQEPQAANVLLKMREINKKLGKNIKLIYIGEDQCGCTADDTFFDLLKINNTLDDINNVYETYYGIHDHIYEIV